MHILSLMQHVWHQHFFRKELRKPRSFLFFMDFEQFFYTIPIKFFVYILSLAVSFCQPPKKEKLMAILRRDRATFSAK